MLLHKVFSSSLKMNIFILITIFSITARLCQGIILSGNIAAAFTPLDDRGYLNLSVIPEYARYLADNNIQGVYVNGKAGQETSFNMIEKQALFRAWVDSAKPFGFIVIAQIGGIPFYDILELAQYCESIGVDVIATLPNLYSTARTAQKLVTELKMVSDAAPSIPIMFYNLDLITPPSVDIEEFYRLALLNIPQFIGIKTNLGNAMTIAAYNQNSNDAVIAVAGSISTRAAFLLGFNATISVASSLFPQLANEIERSVAIQDYSAAEEAQARLDSLSISFNAVRAKAAMEMITGLNMGPPRAPEVAPTYEEKQMMTRALEQQGVQLLKPVY